MPNKKAQSTMEYLIILSAITAAIIIFATGTLKDRVGSMYNHSIDQVEQVTGRLFE